jgi:hypothetical protein
MIDLRFWLPVALILAIGAFGIIHQLSVRTVRIHMLGQGQSGRQGHAFREGCEASGGLRAVNRR